MLNFAANRKGLIFALVRRPSAILLCIPVIVSLPVRAADYVEITVELNSTWQSQRLTNQHSVTARCIVSSNDWFISGEFLKNAKTDYWLIGTNLIEHRTITSSMYLAQAKRFVSEKILGQSPHSRVLTFYPHAGETFTTIHHSPLGKPVFWGTDGVVWLAFCSGSYLKQVGRQIPMPIGPSSRAFGFKDTTALLDDHLGLPKSVKLFATNGTLTCDYEVLATTNFLGLTLPLQFRVIQCGQPDNGRVWFDSKTDLNGRVTSIRAGKPPELPATVLRKLEDEEKERSKKRKLSD